MTNEEMIGILKRFSVGIVDLYFNRGQPPHDSVVVLVLVNPEDPMDTFTWLGSPEDARIALGQMMLPKFPKALDAFDKLLRSVESGKPVVTPSCMLRVFTFSPSGANVGYLSTRPRAQA